MSLKPSSFRGPGPTTGEHGLPPRDLCPIPSLLAAGSSRLSSTHKSHGRNDAMEIVNNQGEKIGSLTHAVSSELLGFPSEALLLRFARASSSPRRVSCIPRERTTPGGRFWGLNGMAQTDRGASPTIRGAPRVSGSG